jgi:hypothetical protein
MKVDEREFPVVVQAYENAGNEELFVAEQVVNTQNEVDNFTSRYAGFVIKARTVSESELHTDGQGVRHRGETRRRSGAGAFWAILLLLLIAAIVIGFSTGWIQRTFNLNTTNVENALPGGSS